MTSMGCHIQRKKKSPVILHLLPLHQMMKTIILKEMMVLSAESKWKPKKVIHSLVNLLKWPALDANMKTRLKLNSFLLAAALSQLLFLYMSLPWWLSQPYFPLADATLIIARSACSLSVMVKILIALLKWRLKTLRNRWNWRERVNDKLIFRIITLIQF